MKRISFWVLFPVMAITLILSSCQQESNKIVLGNEAWTVNRTLTYLTKAILEEKGYEVEIKNQNIDKIFDDLSKGSIDLYMDAWENAHYVYIYEHPKLEDLDIIYEDCKMGIAVPSYFAVDSISELKADSSLYNNQFYGLNRNAGVMISSITAFKNYGMDPQVFEMEEDELMRQIQIMFDKKENFVVSAWKPHWKIKHFDLKFLADTSHSFGEEEDIHVYGRPGFSKSNPEVAQIASNMFLTDGQLNDLLERMKTASNEAEYEAAVKSWIAENRSVVDAWLTEGL